MADAFWRSHGIEPAAPPRIEPAPRRVEVVPKVGRYFENLHHAMLSAGHTVLACHRIVSAQGRTLGELDLLYRTPSGTVVHRELAVKHYLGLHDRGDHESWVGPNRHDRLDRKLERLLEHQVRLPALARRYERWPSELPFPSRTEVLMMGAFFVHPEHAAIPRDAHPDAERGFWCRAAELPALGRAWVCLPKPWWLGPAQARFGPWQDAASVSAWVTTRRRPLLVGNEELRGFVVPEDW